MERTLKDLLVAVDPTRGQLSQDIFFSHFPQHPIENTCVHEKTSPSVQSSLMICLLYTYEDEDDMHCVDIGRRRIINKK